MIKFEKSLVQKLAASGQTLAAAESCTGGLFSHLITNTPGSSSCFLLSVVAYANTIKQHVLGVPKTVLNTKGAVSAEVARAMANGVRQRAKSTYGISITGIAGPGGGSDEKPVGLVYIAVATPQKTIVKKCFFNGTRLQIKKQSAQTALLLLFNQF